MGRTTEDGRTKQFRKDRDLLKKNGYSNEEVAKLLKMDPGNLSSHYTGGKPPGKKFLDKFYAVMGEIIKQLRADYPIDESESTTVEEPMGRYLNERDAHFQTLKLDNEAFRVNLFKVVATNEKLADSAKDMSETAKSLAESVKDMAKSNEMLAQTNQKMVDKHLSVWDELAKRGKENDKGGAVKS